jgi:DNA-binding NtrC family response regulator
MARRILIVDDDAELRGLLRGLLAPLGEIFEAGDGPDALRAVRAEKPQLMLLDVALPGMDGLAVLEDALSIDPKLTVVMLTGDADLHVARRALEGGAREYITKPFDPKTLIGEVSRLLAAAERDEQSRGDRPWRTRG